MHPLIPIIRWWLWQVAAVAATIWLPEAGLALFAGNCFGWWIGDGCCAGITCTQCNTGTAPANFQLVFTGIAEGAGGCATCNQTLIYPFLSQVGSACTWQYGNFCLYSAAYFRAALGLDGNLHYTTGNPSIFDTNTGSAPPQDCTSPWPATLTLSSTSDGLCDFTSATCTVSIP